MQHINCRCELEPVEKNEDFEFDKKDFEEGLHSLANKKQFENKQDNDIIGLTRKARNPINTPMPKEQFRTIVKSFERKGGIILHDKATEEYLLATKNEGITLNESTIMLMRNPSRASVYEELIHSAQYRMGKMGNGTAIYRVKCEIEAQEKLLRNQNAYKLTAKEVSQTKKALKEYKQQLVRIKNGSIR